MLLQLPEPKCRWELWFLISERQTSADAYQLHATRYTVCVLQLVALRKGRGGVSKLAETVWQSERSVPTALLLEDAVHAWGMLVHVLQKNENFGHSLSLTEFQEEAGNCEKALGPILTIYGFPLQGGRLVWASWGSPNGKPL